MNRIPKTYKGSSARTSPPVSMEALGQSEPFIEFQERLSRVASINRPVLIMGERGTGKELAATRLHYLSQRWDGPLVTLNCAALSPSLIETELFGHEKGAFTGAYQRRTGRFEAANNGTLFLDEIGTIPIETQEKILRVVEYGVFERVGSPLTIEVDVRIICATNANLIQLAEEGRFKRDLIDRLSFEVLLLPPLRQRGGDILLIAEHFARRMAVELEWHEVPRFSAKAVRALEAYTWPGNIRELKNVVERAVYRSTKPLIADIIFDPFPLPHTSSASASASQTESKTVQSSEPSFLVSLMHMPLKRAVQQLEIFRLREALTATQFNQKKAADLLGLTYDQFRGLHRKYVDYIR